MKKIFLMFILLLSTNVFATDIIADDTIDDTIAFNELITAKKLTGGGKITLPNGKIIISDRLYFNTYQNYINWTIEGSGATEILINGDATDIIFYFGNNNNVQIKNITFTGRNVSSENPQFIDCGYLIFANYVDKMIISNVQFIGIRADQAIVYSGLADTSIENSDFMGSSGHSSSVEVGITLGSADTHFRGLTVRNCMFLDYGNYRATNYWKSSFDNNFWIKVTADLNSRNLTQGFDQRSVRIEDTRFDEGATVAIGLTNVALAKIEGITVNVNSSGNSRAIDLFGVVYAEVNFSRFGYTLGAKPAIKATNSSFVSLKGINTGEGVFLGNKDNSSSIYAIQCKGNCTVNDNL